MRPATPLMLMIRPARALSIGLAMARVIQNGPERLVSMTGAHSSASIRIIRLSRVMPALLTRMSTLPNSSSAALTIASHASRPAMVSPWIDRCRASGLARLGDDRLRGVRVVAIVDRRRRRPAGKAPARWPGPARGCRRSPGPPFAQVEHQRAPAASSGAATCGSPRRVCSPGARKARAGSAVHSTTAAPAV